MFARLDPFPSQARCHSTEIHELFHAFVRGPKALAESLQCGPDLCCIGHGLRQREIETLLRVIVMFCT